MRFDVITLFPELFIPFLTHGVTRRAFAPLSIRDHGAATEQIADLGAEPSDRRASAAVQLELWNPRDFSTGNYRRIDDRPFGGGPGMVMMAQPLAACLKKIETQRGDAAPVLLFAPGGQRLNDALVRDWAQGQGAVLVCGRYEGVDQRFIDAHVDQQVSLGDFILSGGEIAALALLDAVARLVPGVLNDARSHEFESFNPALDGLLDCPQFTRPEVWDGRAAPEVLLSGRHDRIERWRREQRLIVTARMRPDLLEDARKAGRLSDADEAALANADL